MGGGSLGLCECLRCVDVGVWNTCLPDGSMCGCGCVGGSTVWVVAVWVCVCGWVVGRVSGWSMCVCGCGVAARCGCWQYRCVWV